MKIIKYISKLFNLSKNEFGDKKSTSKDKYVCYFYVAGLNHENRRLKIKSINKKTKISLVPEPDNLYDDTAVAVYAENIGKIGYVPAYLTMKANDYIADGQYNLVHNIEIRDGLEQFHIEIIRDTKPTTYRERRATAAYNERVEKQKNTNFNEEELFLISSIKQMLTDHGKSLEKVTFTRTAKYFDVTKFTKIIRIRLGAKLKYVLIDKNDNISLPTSEGDSSEKYYARVHLNSVTDIYMFTDYIIKKYEESDVEEYNYLNKDYDKQ